jgi:hypothetical protein
MRANHTKEWNEIRRRAAEIQRNWTPTEKARRTGLPPDVPSRLRQFILGEAEPQWSTVLCGRIPAGAVERG